MPQGASLRTKLIAIAGGLLFLFATVLLAAGWLQLSVDQEVTGIFEHHIPVSKAVADVEIDALQLERDIDRALRQAGADLERHADEATLAEQREKVRRHLRQSIVDATTIVSTAIRDERHDVADRIAFSRIEGRLLRLQKEVDTLLAASERLTAALVAGNAEASREEATLVRALEVDFEEELEGIRGELGDILTAATVEAERSQHAMFTIAVGLFGLAAVSGLLLSLLLSRQIIGAINRVTNRAREVVESRTVEPLPVTTKDEIGDLVLAFNSMVEELRQRETIEHTFGKFVDPRIVASLISPDGRDVDTAERKTATIFFSDIKGFSAMSEALTASALVKLLNTYFSLCGGLIRERNGVIDKYIGDAIMAFWVPPFCRADDMAANACLAALDQSASLTNFRRDLPELLGMRRNLPDFSIRMGIATGEVVLGTVGSEMSKSYTVIGDTVNIASRLEGANAIYGTAILVNEETARLADEAIALREIDSIVVHGKTEPVRIFEVMGTAGDDAADGCGEALRRHYADGLDAYRRRDWDAAETALGRCLSAQPDDGPSAVLLSRIATFRKVPPPADWDGVWRLSAK